MNTGTSRPILVHSGRASIAPWADQTANDRENEIVAAVAADPLLDPALTVETRDLLVEAIDKQLASRDRVRPPKSDSTVAPVTTPPLVAQRAGDVMGQPRPVAIVEAIAWAGALSVLVSESGAGKTFVLLDLAAAVSAGLPWHGRQTRPASVVYLGFEGDALGQRLRALRDVQRQRLEHVYLVRASDPLSPRVTRDGEERSVGELALAGAIDTLAIDLAAGGLPAIGLLIIDTVRASLAGSEDSSEDVSAYLRAIRRLMQSALNAAVILAHHAGWQDGEAQRRRERGSSAWRGNADATLYLEAEEYDAERGEARLVLSALKVRDAERPAPLHLIRRRVELAESAGEDVRLGPVTSCVIESDRRTRADREAEQEQAVEAETREVDLRTMRVIVDRPDLATSLDTIRLALNARKAIVGQSVGRLVRRGWVSPGGRGRAYSVTSEGLATLSETP